MWWQVLLTVLATVGTALGLTVGSVHLHPVNREYMIYSKQPENNNSVIKCDYSLDEGEQVTRVVWQFLEDQKAAGEYVWSAGDGGNAASGRLEGVVNLTRTDAALHLTELRYNLSGYYSCLVELSSGEAMGTEPWELLIVDVIGGSHFSHNHLGCSFTSNYQSALTFPELTIAAGIYSKSHGGFLKQVTDVEWQKAIMPNNSVRLSFSDFTYNVNAETPKDAAYTVEWGMTKKNGQYLSRGSYYTNVSQHIDYGCPDVEGENKEVYYKHHSGNSVACRGDGRKDDTTATITCRDGYRGAGEVQSVWLECHGASMTWKPVPGATAGNEDLVCEATGGDGSPKTTALSSSLFVASLLFLLGGYK